MAKSLGMPQHKAMAMGSKSQVSVPTGGALAKTMKAPAQMMKPVGGTKPAAVKPMKGLGVKGKGKI